MTISKKQLEAWESRKLKNSSKAKKFSSKALDRKLAKLDPPPDFHTEPRKHQKVCFLLGTKYPGYLFLLDMGLGKTKLLLDIIKWKKDAEKIDRALVLVPFKTNVGAWKEEAEKHQPGLRVAALSDGANAQTTLDALVETGDFDVLVSTYAGWQSVVCPLTAVKGSKTRKRIFCEKKMRKFGKLFKLVVADESTFIKNHRSTSFRIMRGFRQLKAEIFGLTGTPLDKKPEELWSQFFAVDGGESLGKNLGTFRAAFYREKEGYWTRSEWTFREGKRELLSKMMRNRSIRYAIDDCVDLPPAISREVRFPLPVENWKYYERLIEEFSEAKGNREVIESVYLRMRQLSSGYIKVKGDEVVESQDIVFRSNPKLDALEELLQEIPENEKVIVFNVFHKTGDLIEERLKKRKISFARLYGKTRGKEAVVSKWKKSKARVLLASKSGAFGLNLQVARRMIFAESFDSAIDREQAARRIRRMGQDKTTFYYDLIARATVDEKILASVREGRDLLESLVDGSERF